MTIKKSQPKKPQPKNRVELDIRQDVEQPITNIRFADSQVRGGFSNIHDCGTVVICEGELHICCPYEVTKRVLLADRETTLNLIEALKKALTLPNVFCEPSTRRNSHDEESESESESDNDM